jgi:tryptophan synthase alpha chain
MSRIGSRFEQLKREGRKALITFITAGDPDLALTERLVPQMAAAGADIIELGIPFSDPMADGPVIQLSSERALAGGANLRAVLAMVKNIRQGCDVPILLMGYYNPVLAFGLEGFCREAAASGVDAVLLVDLPPEEAGELVGFTKIHGLDFIPLLTPTSDISRINKIKKCGSGFIYYVSVAGVTGARSSVATDIGAMVESIRLETALPVAVGFGISTPEQAGSVARLADGVVVGSALVKLFEQFTGDELVLKVTEAVAALKLGIKAQID